MITDIPFYFRKEPVYSHMDCKNFDEEVTKCTDRQMRLNKKDMACKNIDLKFVSNYTKFDCKHCGELNKMTHAGSSVVNLKSGKTSRSRIFKCECDGLTMVYQTEDSQIVLAIESPEAIISNTS